ncbi:hypothetical protein I5F94_01475 [Proteus mirabilis]|nr:hypothetical protein EHQ66_07900 [Proteus mirabilis]NAC32967.1 hypothetical protein [Escherichia coli]KSX93731.1 hypothetical protein APT96_16905 [Proteus mirabilis]MBG2992831.1 hypothetical protein [Proteus mirabilis]MBG6040120.1 hypothetical protein [Proteus mirabilis]
MKKHVTPIIMLSILLPVFSVNAYYIYETSCEYIMDDNKSIENKEIILKISHCPSIIKNTNSLLNIKNNTTNSIKNSTMTSFILDNNKVLLANNIDEQLTISVHYQ